MSVLRGVSLTLSLFLTSLLLAPAATADGAPPDAPRDVAGEATADGRFLLTWQPPASGDADGYRVYENGVLVADVSVESFLTPQQTAAAYTVTAYNEFGESGPGTPVVGGLIGTCVTFKVPPEVDDKACEAIITNAVGWALDQIPDQIPP